MEEQITPGQVAKKYGLIYALVSTVITLIPMLTETAVSVGIMLIFVNIIVAMVFFILAGKEFKKLNGGYMTFGEGFKINMIAASIVAGVRSIIVYVYVKVIDTGYGERMAEMMKDQWERGGMQEEQVEQMSGMMSGMTNPEITLFSGIITMMLGGLIWGAIAAAITKSEEDEF